MTGVLLTLAIAADLARTWLNRRRDPIGHAIRHQPATGRVPAWVADHSLDRLAQQARRPRGLNFATPEPTGRC